MSLIPVTILTGFLGSGKSTLLSQILKDPAFSNSAVIVNEFGEVGLDDFLVTHSEEQTVEMTTGCLCCTVRGDISETLLDLYQRRNDGDIKAFDRIIVETTGLADPAPVIHTLISDPRISKRYMLCGLVCTIDAVNGDQTLDTHQESIKQAAMSDRILITKTDLIEDYTGLSQRLSDLNPTAQILHRNHKSFNLEQFFNTTLYNPQSDRHEVEEWLNAEKLKHDHSHHHHHHHGHDHEQGHTHEHHHDVNRHGDGIEAFSIVLDDPISSNAFVLALKLLISNQGEHLLRIKGIINLREQPENPVIIHGVQHVFHDPMTLEEWPSDDHRTKLVFITRNISKETIQSYLSNWLNADEEVILGE